VLPDAEERSIASSAPLTRYATDRSAQLAPGKAADVCSEAEADQVNIVEARAASHELPDKQCNLATDESSVCCGTEVPRLPGALGPVDKYDVARQLHRTYRRRVL